MVRCHGVRGRRAGSGAGLAVLAMITWSCAGVPQEVAEEVVVVTLEATAAEGGCARVEPAEATVWRPERPGRPHQVEWVVNDPGSHHWTIERDPAKPGGDHFGRQHVRCDDASPRVRSGLPARLPARGEARWGYRVVLRACGQPAGEPICTVDPTIIIRDQGY